MNLLITGSNGFVGSNLSSYLKKDLKYKIIGVSRKKSKETLEYQDLTVEVLNTVGVFIHLAGKAHDIKKTPKEQEYFQINTELTKELFDKFLKSNCEIFIYMSSVKAVADKVEGVLKENHTPSPITVYGKSKLAAENYILSQEISSNKRVYILRPCMIHGEGNKGNLSLLYNFVSKGIPYPFGSYKNQRSFLSVDNLCFVIKSIIENKSITNGIYNVADDKSLSTNSLVKIIGKTINKEVRILNIDKSIINLVAKIGDFLPFPISSEKVQKLTENYVVSNERIKKHLKIEKFPLSVEEGIIKTINSFNNKK